LNAYEVTPGPRGPAPHPLTRIDIAEGRERLSDQLTDKAGAYTMGGDGSQGGGANERLTLAAELEKRAVKRLGREISLLLQRHEPTGWALAAPGEINGALLERIAPEFRRSLAENISSDLTHLPMEQMFEHFAEAGK
jgi:hypothetical protein